MPSKLTLNDVRPLKDDELPLLTSAPALISLGIVAVTADAAANIAKIIFGPEKGDPEKDETAKLALEKFSPTLAEAVARCTYQMAMYRAGVDLTQITTEEEWQAAFAKYKAEADKRKEAKHEQDQTSPSMDR